MSKSIIELYNSLCGTRDKKGIKAIMGIKGIRDTSASKILHILKPGLFVMWDNQIREFYVKDSEEKEGSAVYISFLKKMQDWAKCLKN